MISGWRPHGSHFSAEGPTRSRPETTHKPPVSSRRRESHAVGTGVDQFVVGSLGEDRCPRSLARAKISQCGHFEVS